MESDEDGEQDLVIGRHDFQGQRLNILQIGLGTFSTFFENVAEPFEEYPTLHWLLDAARDSSANLLGVGVEPVPKHVDRLRPHVSALPNTALVRAAVGKENEPIDMFAIDTKQHQKALSELEDSARRDCEERIIYLENMSCVGQGHPEFAKYQWQIQDMYGVEVKLRQVPATLLSYDRLSRMLGFSGADVLMIDAEGHDCKILQSMIDHCEACEAEGNHTSWPDVIQFETMGHNDHDGWLDSEDCMIESLESHGYLVASRGHDTQMVRADALEAEARLQQWLDHFSCGCCGNFGEAGMPYNSNSDSCSGSMCSNCYELWIAYGLGAWEWHVMPGQGAAVFTSLATSGTCVWALDSHGRAWCHSGKSWQVFGGSLEHFSVCSGGLEKWGVSCDGYLVSHTSGARDAWVVKNSKLRLRMACSLSDGSAIWVLDRNGCVSICSPTGTQLHELGGNLDQMSVSSDGAHIWGVSSNDEVYYREGRAGSWEVIPGQLRQVAVSADGAHIWGVNSSGNIYYRVGRYGHWLDVTGFPQSRWHLQHMCVSDDGWKVWGLDKCGSVWTFEA